MLILDPEKNAEEAAGGHSIMVCGDSQVGKTTLMAHYVVALGEVLGRKVRMLYIASDRTSRKLESIPHDIRPLLLGPVIPQGRPSTWREGDRPDWYTEAIEIALERWETRFSDIGAVCIDTITPWAMEVQNQIALKQQFVGKDKDTGRDKSAPLVGKQGSGWETVQAAQGDYGLSQNAMRRLVGFFQDNHPTLDLLVGAQLAKDGNTHEFGPATTGHSNVRGLTYMFGTVLGLQRVMVKGVPKVLVHTQHDGQWIAGVKMPLGQVFTHDPVIGPTSDEMVAFWRGVLEAKGLAATHAGKAA